MEHDLIIGVIAVIVLAIIAYSKYKTHTKTEIKEVPKPYIPAYVKWLAIFGAINIVVILIGILNKLKLIKIPFL